MELDDEEQAVQIMMQATLNNPVSSMDLQNRFGFNEETSFQVATDALEEGKPICISTCEDSWLSFAESDAPIYFFRADIDDLNDMDRMLVDHADRLNRIHAGLAKARRAVSKGARAD